MFTLKLWYQYRLHETLFMTKTLLDVLHHKTPNYSICRYIVEFLVCPYCKCLHCTCYIPFPVFYHNVDEDE